MTLEGFIDAVIAHLKVDLPPRIVALNALLDTDGRDIVVLIPKEACYSTGGDPIVAYPFVEVAAPDFAMSNFSIAQIDADFLVDVVVRGWITEPRPPIERADRHIKRFGSVLMESLVQPGAFGPGEVIESVRGAYRINPEYEEREGPMAAVTLVFSIASVNVRP